MKNILLIALLCGPALLSAQDSVKISGYVSDFEGNRIAGAEFDLIDVYWQSVASAFTDQDGYYQMNVPKGEFMAMTGMVTDEYPREDAVPEEDMRLEFWAWNVIADRDLEINPRYHRLELYGTTVFEIFGGYPGFFVYFRPMGVTKYVSYEKEVWMDKTTAENTITDISVDPDHLQVWVYGDEEELKINSIQRVEEYVGEGKVPMGAYLLQVDRPVKRPDKPYIVFRVVAKDTHYNEMGENIYFYKLPGFYP
ncbi:MAG: carboxypeptidase-like regulatory domain-containing protein [Rikenellaceae bacterium]|nr:carboxypeptidase-like regulatory domain-containing protein [Rikenellaceae bacterium]